MKKEKKLPLTRLLILSSFLALGANANTVQSLTAKNKAFTDTAIAVHELGKKIGYDIGPSRSETLYNLAVYYKVLDRFVRYIDANTIMGVGIQNPEAVEKELLNLVAQAHDELTKQFKELKEHKVLLYANGISVDEWEASSRQELDRVSNFLWGKTPLNEIISGNFTPHGDAHGIFEARNIINLEKMSIKAVYDEQRALTVKKD